MTPFFKICSLSIIFFYMIRFAVLGIKRECELMKIRLFLQAYLMKSGGRINK